MSGIGPGRPDRPGLALFLNAGDPPLDLLVDVLAMLDEERVDVVELAVPFPDSVTDGPVIRASSVRALDRGVGYGETLDLIAAVAPGLDHLRLVAMVDWRHTIVPRSITSVTADIAATGAAGLLVHAIPPRFRPGLNEAAAAVDLPLVATCYANSGPEVVAEAVANAGAYLYLASTWSRTGGAGGGPPPVAGTIDRIRRIDPAVTVAVGFGITSPADVARVHREGADLAVVGSAFVGLVADGPDDHHLPERLQVFVRSLRDQAGVPA